MDPRITISHEQERGCGYRKENGLYLVGSGMAQPCGKLPLPLDVCRTCSSGIKQSRGWTWLDANSLFENFLCKTNQCSCSLWNLGIRLSTQVFANPDFSKVGLLWIGEKFYSTPDDFIREAKSMGISRRIHAVPRDFKVGETWVFLAHRKAITTYMKFEEVSGDEIVQSESAIHYLAGISYVFKPTAVEYIVRGDESEEEIDSLLKRGLTPVKVERIGEELELEIMDESSTFW